tara:strand:+ start:95 stop:577 length:483 start_codon:yes stop_codon:yes gene_type:complete
MSYQTQVITFINDNGVAFTDVDAATAAIEATGDNSVTGPLFHSLQDDAQMFADNIIVDGSLVSTWVMNETAATQITAAPNLVIPGVTVVYGAVGSVDTHAVLDNHGPMPGPGVDGSPTEEETTPAPGVDGSLTEEETMPAPGVDGSPTEEETMPATPENE